MTNYYQTIIKLNPCNKYAAFEINDELGYLNKIRPNTLTPEVLHFYAYHPNTFRLIDNFILIEYLHSLRNTINIYTFQYEYPYQFNEYLLQQLLSINEDNEYHIACINILQNC